MEPSRAERSFTCTHCDRTFRRLEHLQRHTRIHTKEKPFTCHCGASFTRRDLLKRHSRIAHPPSPTQASNAGDVCVGDISLGIDTQVSLDQILLSEGNYGDKAIVGTSLSDQYFAKRNLSLPLPPEYRHVEEAFRCESSGNALHNALKDLLEDSKPPPATRSQLEEGASAAPGKGKRAVTQQTAFVDGPSGTLQTKYALLAEPWQDSDLQGTTGLRQKLVQSLLRHVRSTELLPSAQRLSRYVGAFMAGFHERYPVFHTQTMPIIDLPADVGLSLLAVGADSCHEFKAATYLFESAVAVSSAGRGNTRDTTHAVFASDETSSMAAAANLSGESAWLDESSHILCVMLLLTVFGLENRSPPVMQTMWSVQGVFAHELRQSLRSLDEDPEDEIADHPTSWSQWARRESKRRIKHAAFCVLNLVSMTFNFPAAVPFAQLHVAVPCSAEEWRAPSESEWVKVRRSEPPLLSGIVESLLAGGRHNTHSPSTLGDFTVLHAILQRIQALRQALPVIPQDISVNMESSIFPFTKFPPESAYFKDSGLYLLAGVAHLQLHLDVEPFPTMSQDMTQLATWLRDFSLPKRHPQLFPVLRSAIYMLDTQIVRGLSSDSHPFSIGVDPQGFLCVTRLSIFLIKWLLLIAASVHEQTVSEDEQKIVESAVDVVGEAGRCIELGNPCNHRDPMTIATGISRMMGHVCQRSPKEHVSISGKAFELYATMLQDGGYSLEHQPVA